MSDGLLDNNVAKQSDIEDLISKARRMNLDLSYEAELIQNRINEYTKNQDQNYSSWQRVLMNRNSDRPRVDDYIRVLCDDWIELHGDRCFGDDPAVIGGIGEFQNMPVTILGYRRGTNIQENIKYNFGMPSPEGFRKMKRLLLQAEKYKRPVLTLIDTPGAHSGISAEERGQAWAISQVLITMCTLKVPIVSLITGEGGSGGALALAVSDRLLMLSNAIFSVTSPEVCSSILFRDISRVEEVASLMKITGSDLYKLGLVNEVIEEPYGDAGRDFYGTATKIKDILSHHFSTLLNQNIDEILKHRHDKLRAIGVFNEI